MTHDLPYRACAGAVVFGPKSHVFVGRRADLPKGTPEAWQFPQGGIDAGEAPRDTVLRELAEEIGTNNADIIAEHPDWLHYDLPEELRRTRMGRRYRGQRQRWFALKFLGTDADIKLDAHHPIEFDAWRWLPLADVPALVVPFKRHIYDTVARDFAHLVG